MNKMAELQRVAKRRALEMHERGWTEAQPSTVQFNNKKQPVSIVQRFYRLVDGEKVWHGESERQPMPDVDAPHQYPDD